MSNTEGNVVMRFLPGAVVILFVSAHAAFAEGINCGSFYENKLQGAIAAGNLDGRDGASYYLGFIRGECSPERAARAEKLLNDARARIARESAEARKRIERAAAETRAAEEEEQRIKRVAAENHRLIEAKLAEQADQNDWAASGVDACRAPSSLNSCDAVRAYLKAHPSGKHVEEATQCLNEAEPKFAPLRAAAEARAVEERRLEQQRQDEADWQEAIGPEMGMSKCEGCKVEMTNGNLASCRRPQRSDACATLEKYLSSRPSGAHAAEAQRIIKASTAKIASLRKQEEAREQVGESIQQLCTVIEQLGQLEAGERLQRRVDAASGTVNLYQKRQNATGRVLLHDQRQKLMKEIARAGVRFNEKRDCTADQQ